MNEKPPTRLGTKARRMWNDITTAYELRADELRVLEDACREIDLIERMEAEQRGLPLVVKGSQGQDVAAPLVQELRQHRATLARLLLQLKLPDEGGEAARSSAARELAMARWAPGGA